MSGNENSMIAKGFTKPTDRVKRLKNVIVDAVPVLEYERAMIVTEAYKENENLVPIMRRAKAMEKVLNNMQVTIRDDELIVGSPTAHSRSSEVFPEFSLDWLIDELDTLSTRETDPYYVSEECKEALRSIQPYWKGRTNSDYALSLMSPEVLDAQDAGVFDLGNFLYAGVGHSVVNYERIVKDGFKKVIEDCEEAKKNLNYTDPDCIVKEQFYNALQITFTAAINFAHRYAKKAEEMAAQEGNPIRKAELLQIAKNLYRVPENGASNFYEAIQSFWIVHCIIRIESNGYSYSPGPFDRYMNQFYENDHEISEEFATELLDCLFVKMNDSNTCRDKITAQAFAGYNLFEQVALGGQDEEGKDLTNPLTYLVLNATAQVGMPIPSVGMRVSDATPDELLYRAAEVIRLGYGFPALFNDEIIIPALMNRGVPLSVARTFTPSGCVEPDIAHHTDGWHSAAFINTAKIVEITLHNGRNGNKQLGPKTGELTSFTCMQDIIDALHEQMEYFIGRMVEGINCMDIAHGKKCPNPFQSALIEDCIAKGKSVQEGGAEYNFTGPQGFAFSDSGDSLYAIAKNVFEDKKIALAELEDALVHNFGYSIHDDDGICCGSEGTAGGISVDDNLEAKVYEAVKAVLSGSGNINLNDISSKVSSQVGDNSSKYAEIHKLLDNTISYGNDVDEIDRYAQICFNFYCEILQRYPNARGGMFQAGAFPVSGHVLYGKFVGALPNGRLAKKPVADGVSPRAGKDTNGPTAAANSVSKLNHALASNGTLYNQKYLPAALAGDTGLKNLTGLVRGYFDRKGMEIQFNCIDRETLVDAQIHPEKHKNLVIRVAGYSAHFTKLAKDVQDDLISRTELTF